MVTRVPLTAEFIDTLLPPPAGERWISDAALPGFGVRLWAGANGGGSCYAIRVRNHHGKVVRESFSFWSDWHARLKIRDLADQEVLDLDLGMFLEEAREWARDRIRILKGGKSRADRRHELRSRASEAARLLTLDQMADRAFWKMEKAGRNADYKIQLQKLFWRLSEGVRSSTLASMDVRHLAEEIADASLPIMQSRALQSFVGHLYARVDRWYYSVSRVKEALDRRISDLRRKQRVPHPPILKITPAQYARFLDSADNEEEHWREALALKLYFETGAKLRRVLRARWDQIIGDTWYPYSPKERDFWFVGREHIDEATRGTLERAHQKLASEGRVSAYIFPSKNEAQDRPITTIRRYWLKAADRMGWRGLPLSHVVLRHRPRNTPSYLHMYTYMWVPISRQTLDPDAVSKLENSLGENTADAGA
jgi:hypothetical protein